MSIMEEMMSKMDKAMSENKQKPDKAFQWTEDGLARLERVPEGFMRNMTKVRIEDYAEKSSADKITLEVAEAGISGSRDMMTSMMGSGAEQEEEQEEEEESLNFQIDENVDYYYCDVCGYTVKGYAPDECPVCRAPKEKFKAVENKNELVTPSSGRVLDWSSEAIERLSNVPEGFMREMTKWRIEAFVRQKGSLEVTEELIEQKYQYWGEWSKKAKKELLWEKEALKKIEKIPSFVRGMVIKEIEREAQGSGENKVTSETLSRVRNKWGSTMEFHSDTQSEFPVE